MTDVILLATIMAFFAAAALLVRVFDHMIVSGSGLIYFPMLILGPIGERIVG